ncbi:hypothetical protein RugamoR1_20560 [Rugamonas sp. R1(2021)]
MNEISGRYSVLQDEFYVPELDDVRPQSQKNKQGRSEESLDDEIKENFVGTLVDDQKLTYHRYEGYIKSDIARELARINLPLSLYTEFYWQIDLHNLFHFLRLRLDAHAQKEIRVYGEALSLCAKNVAPMAYKSFENHVLHSKKISKSDIDEMLEAVEMVNDPRLEEIRKKLSGK